MFDMIKSMLHGRSQVAADWVARAVAALPLLLVASTVHAVDVRVGVLGNAALSQLTHTTCTVSPVGTSAKKRYLLVEGPACPLGGGACPHVALMKIDRRTVAFTRVDEPRQLADGTWTSAFKQGDMSLSIDMIPRPPGRTTSDSNSQYDAVLTLNDGKGHSPIVKGVANCYED
jgi:hypothetical protein